jgi:hypothetical protein
MEKEGGSTLIRCFKYEVIAAEQGGNFTGQALLSHVEFWEMTLDRN